MLPEAVITPTLSPVLQKILIANRGEIAVRVIRAAKEMGIATVAVYSELDRDALHVRLADEAYALGGQTVTESYINTEAVLGALAASGADSIHPGYGFFSENADFARAVTALGIEFIGPPASAMDEMSDKVSSRQAAIRGDVPIVPGTTEFASGPEEIRAFGEEFGWPVCIKAAFGGGGRGMKVVQSAAEVDDAMASAQREAKSFFGRDEVYVERYLTWPRHVEVQLVGDKHGNVVWISTRDCSAQRRHQKLIEEAPAPGLAPGIEEAMGEAAVKAAKAVGYVGAGTVEFIYQDEQFFFLEMNTRLQVEHPVSEMITDIDLVEWQIRVASGEELPMTQEEVNASRARSLDRGAHQRRGSDRRQVPSVTRPDHEADRSRRVRCPFRHRLPLRRLDQPVLRQPRRQAHRVGHGPRDVAIARTIRALEEMTVEGVATTIPADLAILRHPDFAAVEHSTKWVEERLDLSAIAPPVRPQPSGDDDEAVPLVKRSTTVEVNGKRFDVEMWVPEQAAVAVGAAPAKKAKRGPSAAGAAGAGSGSIEAPMQGTIVKVLVEVGQVVEAGVGIVVLEAMKMENQINADKAGTVKEIRVAAGDTVGGGDVLAIIE